MFVYMYLVDVRLVRPHTDSLLRLRWTVFIAPDEDPITVAGDQVDAQCDIEYPGWECESYEIVKRITQIS